METSLDGVNLAAARALVALERVVGSVEQSEDKAVGGVKVITAVTRRSPQ